MKNLRFIVLIPLLLATTCAPKFVNLKIINNNKEKYFITYTKDFNKINVNLKSNYVENNKLFKIDNTVLNQQLIEPSLKLYKSKNNKTYTFYIIKQSDFLDKNYKFDSLLIPKEKIMFKEEETIKIVIDEKIFFYKVIK